MRYSNSILNPKTVLVQAQAIRSRWPGFNVTVSSGRLKAIGSLQPTSRSSAYSIKVIYSLNQHPDIFVLDPKLKRNLNDEKIPHMYSQEKLCLYRPLYGEFKFSDLISETIIPWACLWLYHYEIWHLTGDWLGGGEHPNE
ncbi:hypothetical protein H8S90_01040 [Olivibacter sp. SDN3]|uniref:Type II CBASS E2 protein domain-containing protein n=1 Tax=Olivibacter jilunii TaxID=985016 RepID=A0ABW6AYY9_9SPHI|nr:hypothetical protein [Olivibacter sp. SDN3]MDX3917223.1 hypothetical protein [Pseudosphingobacterium sp.]QNL50249.1 hypothetical protein H8S90_01040 [Olivibacter sp. SDN3]